MQNAIIPKTTPSLNHPIAVNQRKAPQLLIPCPSWLNPAPDPSASSVKPLRFASMNAHPAGLTARTDRRLPPPRRAFAFHAPLRVARRASPKTQRSDKMQTERAEPYFRQGSSDKVYHLQLENVDDRWSVQAQWGRRGSALQRGIKANGVLTKKRSVCT